MSRSANIIEYSFMGLTAFLICLIAYWYVFPIDPAEFDVDKINIKTHQVKPGGELEYTIPVKKFGVFPADISSTLVGEDGKTVYALPPESGALPPGQYILNQEVAIPKRVNPMWYRLSRIYAYRVNPSTIVMRSYITPCFEVVR